MKKLYMIGNTHFDPVWLWKWDEAMASIRATFRSALERMKEDENFIYSFSTPPVFEWIKKTDPNLFAKIKERIEEGRWELAEGWYLQPDCYGASGESYARQGLYGQKYLKENFGKISNSVFNIDSFGHSPNLPQLLKKIHVECYSFVRPEKHHIALESPLFWWEGINGDKILTFRANDAYAYELSECIENQEEKETDTMIVYGVTDHGGAPTKKMISEINAMENAEFSTVSRFFKEHTDCENTFFGELITGDFGVYANMPEVKHCNRLAEYAVLNAEKSSVIAENYDRKALTECWHDVLFNQFHDILGGACIKEAYFDTRNSLGRAIATANEITHFNLQKLTAQMKTVGKNPDDIWNLVIWNLNGGKFDDYLEAEVQWAHEFTWYDKGIALCDEEGNLYSCQVIDAKAVIPRFRSRFVFKAEIPSLGYKMFKVVKTEENLKMRKINPYSFETAVLKIKFSQSGSPEICGKNGEALYKNILMPVFYCDDGDTWAFNIESYGAKADGLEFLGLKVIESGEIRTIIKAEYAFRSSKLEMFYTFYENETYFDLRYRINFNEKHITFKLESEIKNMEHTAFVPYGSVKRGESSADMPMTEIVRADGVSYIADSVFAYNMHDDKLGLTVLRSPIYGDLRMGEIDYEREYDIQSQGITEGKIRITKEKSDLLAADNFINTPIIIDECNHDGTLNAENTYLTLKNAYLGCLKKCEYDDSEIVRIAEINGQKTEAVLVYKNKEYKFKLSPFEIKTLKITDNTALEVYITEDGEFV